MFHRITSPQLESRCCRWYPWYLSKFPTTTKLSSPSLCHISPEFLIHMLSGMHKANASPRKLNEGYPSNYITSLSLDSISQMQKEHLRMPLLLHNRSTKSKFRVRFTQSKASPSAVTSFATEECQKNSALSSRTKRERDLSQFWNNYITSIEGVLGKTITCGLHEHSYFF